MLPFIFALCFSDVLIYVYDIKIRRNTRPEVKRLKFYIK